MSRNQRHCNLAIASVATFAILAMGCAPNVQAPRKKTTLTSSNSGSLSFEDFYGSNNGGSGTTTTTSGGSGSTIVVDQSGATADDGSASDTGTPPVSYTLRGTGYDGTFNINVRTRTKLKVRFIPGQQDRTVAGTGYSPTYSALAVFIKVGSYEEPTALVPNGAGQFDASSHIIDFSNSFTKTCGSDTSCRQTVQISVSKPNYDYWCLNYQQYCPHTHVYQTHPWNGTLEIQTDDTAGF